MSPGAEVPYDVEVVVGHNIARVGCSRSVVGPCIACSLRSRVAPAPDIICFAPLSIVMKQEPQKKKQASRILVDVISTTPNNPISQPLRQTQTSRGYSHQLRCRLGDAHDTFSSLAHASWGTLRLHSWPAAHHSKPEPHPRTIATAGAVYQRCYAAQGIMFRSLGMMAWRADRLRLQVTGRRAHAATTRPLALLMPAQAYLCSIKSAESLLKGILHATGAPRMQHSNAGTQRRCLQHSARGRIGCQAATRPLGAQPQ